MTLSPEIKKRLIGLASSYEEPYPVLVQGESSYRKNIEKVCGVYDEEEGYNDDAHQAALYLEDDNTFDPGNAVRVEIDDLTVGYLSKSQAKIYRQKLKELNAPEDAIAICGASIKGGFLKKNGETADFGVQLDFDLYNLSLVDVHIRDEKKETSTPALEALKKRLEEKPQPAAVPPPSQPAPKKAFLQNVTEFWRKGWLNKIVTIVVGVYLLFFCCSVASGVISPGSATEPTLDINAVSTNAMLTAWAPFTQTAAAVPSNTATLTNTPLPTATFTPTLSPDILTANAQATRSAEIAQYQPIDVRELITYPNNHIGELIIISGRVFNINSDTELQIMVGDTFDAVYIVSRDPFTGIYEDDTITVYGLVFGENCGENSFGAQVCQPLLMDALLVK